MNASTLKLRKVLTKMLLVAYLGFGVLGFAHALQMADMNMSDCPFEQLMHAVGQDVMTGHIQLAQTPITTLFTVLFFFICFSALKLFTQKEDFLFIAQSLYYKQKRKDLPWHIHQPLFSQGILNTKVF